MAALELDLGKMQLKLICHNLMIIISIDDICLLYVILLIENVCVGL